MLMSFLQAKLFAERSVGGLADGLAPGSALLQLEAAAGDRIEGADIGEDNTAVVWTRRGYIYTLDFAANRSVVGCSNVDHHWSVLHSLPPSGTSWWASLVW